MATIHGDSGDNIIDGTATNDSLYGHEGADTLSGLGGSDILHGQEGDDILNGGDGNDTLYGYAGSNTLNGGAVGDYIVSASGATDTIDGGDGNDWIQLTAGSAFVSLQGGLGDADRIDIFDAIVSDFTTANGIENVYTESSVYGTAGDNILDFSFVTIVANYGAPTPTFGVTVRAEAGADTVQGTNLVDVLYGGGGSNILSGNDGADTIYSDGADTVDGGAGNDIIYLAGGLDGAVRSISGGLGADKLIISVVTLEGFADGSGIETLQVLGGSAVVNGTDNANVLDFSDLAPATGPGLTINAGLGGDTVTGTQGYDVIYGQGGADTLRGEDANDKIYGGDDGDTLYGGAGVDTMNGEQGDDVAYGGDGNDTITASDGADDLWGEGGVDNLKGENGADELYGGLGDDILNGGADNDVINGGGGKDTLAGGTGADRFVFADGDLTNSSATTDRISDFKTVNSDILDLAAIDADTGAGGDQAFVIVGAFSGVAGQATLTTASGTTTLAMDTNGDSIADLLLLMTGTVSSTAGWIL